MNLMINRDKQRGSVIIIVLWTAVLLTVLVTAMAGKVRLSAQTAAHNRDASWDWAQLMAAVNFAEMELMLERMPLPIGDRERGIRRRRTPVTRLSIRWEDLGSELSKA